MPATSIRCLGAGVALLLIVVLAAFQVGDRHMDFHPSMSPDGKRITYYSYRTDAPDIFVRDLASGVERNVTDSEDLWEIEPHWSPTDDRIAYSRGSSMADLEVVVRDLDTGVVLVIDNDLAENFAEYDQGDLIANIVCWNERERRWMYEWGHDPHKSSHYTKFPPNWTHWRLFPKIPAWREGNGEVLPFPGVASAP